MISEQGREGGRDGERGREGEVERGGEGGKEREGNSTEASRESKGRGRGSEKAISYLSTAQTIDGSRRPSNSGNNTIQYGWTTVLMRFQFL